MREESYSSHFSVILSVRVNAISKRTLLPQMGASCTLLALNLPFKKILALFLRKKRVGTDLGRTLQSPLADQTTSRVIAEMGKNMNLRSSA